MKEIVKLVSVLTLICLLSGIMLAWVNDLTAGPIERAASKEKLDAIKEVLPAFDNQPNANTLSIQQDKQAMVFYVARKEGKYAGAAFTVSSSKGYGGDIELMVGVNANGNLQMIKILQQKETPGLGAKIQGPEFKDQFKGKPIKGSNWKVRKDGGDIHEITAATISSRAVVEAIKNGLDIYLKNEAKLRATGADS